MSLEDMNTEVPAVVDTPTDTTPTPDNNTLPQESHYEQEAREQGWRPKEEWQGDPEKWRPAKEFVERGELFSKIDFMGKELKETRKALKMLQEHHSKVKEVEYNRAVAELKALQKQHLADGDADKYLEATELLTDLKAEQKAREVVQEVAPTQNQPDPRFVDWTQRNSWYTKDARMRDYADMVGMDYARRNPDIDPMDVLKFVTNEVKERFKDRFVNPNRNKQSVESSTSGTTPTKDEFKMTEDERKVMNAFIRTNVMTKEEYMKELKAMRGGK